MAKGVERFVKYMRLTSAEYGAVCAHCRKAIRTGEKFRVLGRQRSHECIHEECFEAYSDDEKD